MSSGRTKDNEKTNVMRILESAQIPYAFYSYQPDSSLTGGDIAALLHESPGNVFKTLVTCGKSNQHYVFVVPVDAELNLKKAAKAVGEKSIEMIPQKQLLPLTGYVHGGCSPVGMKKAFPTVIHESAALLDRMYVSGGRVGMQISVAPGDLCRYISAKYADLV